MADWDAAIGSDVYVVLDQFEEYFLYHEGETAGPFEELAEIAPAAGDMRANFLIGIREDALAQLDAFKAQIPNLFANTLRLDRLDRRAGEAAIVGPIERYNRLCPASEPVSRSSRSSSTRSSTRSPPAAIDLGPLGPRRRRGRGRRGTDRGAVPPARARATVGRRARARSPLASGSPRSRELGGAARIVEEHLERAMSMLSPEEQDAAAAMYNHLVTPSGTKIAHRAGDLARYASVDEAQAGTVLDRLARERIVRAGEDGAAGPRYEIFHDVLADAVLAWRTRHEADRRLEEERREGARRHRRLLALAGGALVVVAVLAGVAAYALSQRGSAQDNAREAEASAREAEANDQAALAEATVPTSPERSLSLAVQASESAHTPRWRTHSGAR